MDTLLKLLRENAALSTVDLAGMLELSEEEIRDKIRQAQADGDILGYQAILSDEATGRDGVQAVIEVKLTPERGGGFDRLAERISKYNEVNSCYLMSGSYDVLVIVDGNSLHEVASFVAEKLATIELPHGLDVGECTLNEAFEQVDYRTPVLPDQSHVDALGLHVGVVENQALLVPHQFEDPLGQREGPLPHVLVHPGGESPDDLVDLDLVSVRE